MKRLFLLLVLLGVVFLVYNRERVYVRDVFGSVKRNGVKEAGAQVYINYSNDVLVEQDRSPMYVIVVQQGRPIGTPDHLHCIHWLACMTDADSAGLANVMDSAHVESMSSKEVRFRDAPGTETVVALR